MNEMKYAGRGPSVERENILLAPKKSGVPLFRRWRDGTLLAMTPGLLVSLLGWGLRIVGVHDWTHGLLRNSVLLLAILAIFGLIPLLVYEFAYQLVVIPWFNKYVRESRCEQLEVSEIKEDAT